jgi:hypothetical protein
MKFRLEACLDGKKGIVAPTLRSERECNAGRQAGL